MPPISPAPDLPVGPTEPADPVEPADPPPGSAPRPRRPRLARSPALPPDERRAALVTATLPLLLEHGAAVTTRQIAAAAGVAEGTIFRAFPTKEALIQAACRRVFDVGPTVDQLGRIDRTAPLDDRVRAAARILQHRLHGIFRLLRVMELHHPPADPAADEMRDRSMQALITAVAGVLAPSRDDLRYDPRRAAELLRLVLFAGSHPLITHHRPLCADEIAELFLDGARRHDPRTDPNPAET